MITSLQNPRIKLARQLLSDRKAREESKSFAVEGVRLAEEALQNQWQPQFALWSHQLNERGQQVLSQLTRAEIPVEEIQPPLMDKISDTETPQGLLMVLSQKEQTLPENLNFLLALDGVRDPGNLGTILRTASAFGAQGMILLPGSADPFSSKVLRAAMGAHFRLPLFNRTVEEFESVCKTTAKPAMQILLADMEGAQPCWEVNLKQPLALVIGGEAAGASDQLYRIADGKVLIPMPAGSESLNAAVAASILLYEIMRQRQK
jgi:RNA methyltransferase, TrmH family